MKFKGMIGSMFSGSSGGVTASHNRGGYYLRQRVVPTDPASPLQLKVRSAMSILTTAWNTMLTDSQRAGWNEYALGTPINNALGDPVNIGGKGMFIRGNLPRVYADGQFGLTLGIVASAPTSPGLPTITAAATLISAGTDEVTVTFDNTEAWATAVGGFLLVYTSRVLAPGVNYFRGPYRLAGNVLGAATPPTSPATISLAFPCSTGQKVAVKVIGGTADGRLGPTAFEGILTAGS